jgi:hypothetical protein
VTPTSDPTLPELSGSHLRKKVGERPHGHRGDTRQYPEHQEEEDLYHPVLSNPSTDPDEGRTFLGQMKVATNRQGKASFTFEASRPLAVGDRITATATGRGGTSELSDPVIVEAAPQAG